MRFYTGRHARYRGIDLHARTMAVCIVDNDGHILVERNIRCEPAEFLGLIAPFREDLVVGAECVFCWYWLADLCAAEGLHFVLGHALYMRAIHGGKAKNDRIDAFKIASLLRGGNLPVSYVYPAEMRATRDLLRRRLHLVRERGFLLAHVQNTHHQYNLVPQAARIAHKCNREGVAERFTDPAVQKTVEVDLDVVGHLDGVIAELERHLERSVKVHGQDNFYLLRSVPGIGAKIGNAHLKWAVSEAAVLMLRHGDVERLMNRLRKKHGKAKAMGVLAHKLGRTIYYMLLRRKPFDLERFLAA